MQLDIHNMSALWMHGFCINVASRPRTDSRNHARALCRNYPCLLVYVCTIQTVRAVCSQVSHVVDFT